MVNTYCSSVYVGIHRAIQSLRHGECEQALVGGINIINPAYPTFKFGVGQDFDILSPTNTTKSFDDKANGFVRSEGAGLLFLKPLKKAEADGDKIVAVIKGSYVHHGGKNLAFEAPNAKGIKETIKGCLAKSGLEADTIDYIEAHGIANPMADAIELSAIDAVYAQKAQATNKKWHISTIKPTVGHSELASGMASIIKVIKAFEHQTIPGIPGLDQVNGELNPNHSLILSKAASPWENGKHPRRAALNGYSVGGVNAHIILEEYTGNVTKEKVFNPDRKDTTAIVIPVAPPKAKELQPTVRETILAFTYDIFNIRAEELNLDLSPIDYDFDSIKVTKFVRRLNAHYGIEVKLGQVISVDDFDTMFALFETAVAQKSVTTAVVEKEETVTTATRYPLSEGQKGLWIIQEAAPNSTAYNVPVALH